MTRVFNFSAGPAMLPDQVLRIVREELYNWNNLGISVMEVSHRSKEFYKLQQETKKNLRELLAIPENYKILFCHGGARGQFSAIPMNLLSKSSTQVVDYINTGFWSYQAAIEAKKYCNPRIIDVFDNTNTLRKIQSASKWDLSEDSIYVHCCLNETIDGISIYEDLNFSNKILVADCSSMLLSRPLNVENFGIIYAAAQKNLGISGLTVVIIRQDLIDTSYKQIPSILDYGILSTCDSMFNTPSTMSWYISNLIFRWLKKQGGLREIYKFNKEKADLLYDVIDNSSFYSNCIDKHNRSYMNVPFFLRNNKLEDIFLSESLRFNLYGLKGHRSVGGMRASLYNAMSLEGVQQLVKFLKSFIVQYNSLI